MNCIIYIVICKKMRSSQLCVQSLTYTIVYTRCQNVRTLYMYVVLNCKYNGVSLHAHSHMHGANMYSAQTSSKGKEDLMSIPKVNSVTTKARACAAAIHGFK